MRLLIFFILILFNLPSSAENLPNAALNNNPFFNGQSNPGNANPPPFSGEIIPGNSNQNPPPFLDIINNDPPITPQDPPPNMDTVAVGIYINGEMANTLLNGRFGFSDGNSNLVLRSQSDVLNDLIKSGNEIDASSNSQILKVNGVVYSSTGIINLTISPASLGSSNFIPSNSISVRFNNINGLGEIDIAFNGNFIGLTTSVLQGSANAITNAGNISTNIDKKANFNLKGDVIEASVSNQDDVGVYQGGIIITLTSL